MVRQESERHHRIFGGEDASALPEGQLYIAYISYSDWMDGHSARCTATRIWRRSC